MRSIARNVKGFRGRTVWKKPSIGNGLHISMNMKGGEMNMVKYIFGKGKKSGKFMIYEYSKKFDEWQPNFEYSTDMKGKVERDYKELERDAKIFHEDVTAFRKNKKWIIK